MLHISCQCLLLVNSRDLRQRLVVALVIPFPVNFGILTAQVEVDSVASILSFDSRRLLSEKIFIRLVIRAAMCLVRAILIYDSENE